MHQPTSIMILEDFAMTRFSAAILTIVLSISSVYAQLEKTDTLEYQYPTDIMVTAPRLSLPVKETPFPVAIITSEQLGTIPRGVAADEPLKLVPGVKVDNQANGERVHLSMRGQGILTERGIRGIRILLDNLPLNDPTGFAPDFFDVDFSVVDRIEVLRGPAASIYGGSASGGILNIVTQQAPNVPLFGEAFGTVGSNNFWKGGVQFGGTNGEINHRISFSRVMGDGYRDHTHFWGNVLQGKATYTVSGVLQLTPVFGATHVYHENPEGINLEQYHQDPLQANPDAIPYNEYLETERVGGGVHGIVLFGDHQLQFSGFARRTLFTEANNRTFNHRTIQTPGASLEYSFHTGKPEQTVRNTVTCGTDLQWQTIDERRVDNLHAIEGDTLRSKETIRQRGIGLFVIDKVDIRDNWSVMVSLRYDQIHNELEDLLRDPYDLSGEAEFSKTTGRVGAIYSPVEDLNLYANYGQGFLPPATEELAQNPDNFGGFNSHLVPATSQGVDLGVRGSVGEKTYYDVTGFYLTTENDFDRYRITDSLRSQETFYRNAGSSRRFGLEVYTRTEPVHAVVVQAAYTFSDFRYTNATPLPIVMDDPTIVKNIVDGNRLPNCPVHQLGVDVRWMPLRSLRLNFSMEALSKAYIDGANVEAEAVEGYALWHVRLGYDLPLPGLEAELTLSARNLTDQKYVAFSEPDPGGNAYQPGAGREFFGGLRIRL
jgi:iron complex outermembrane recepter protein